ncbi:DNA polymerase III subunit delta' [Alisedimentitalea sp. MJ-SS2]|uniref:DNA polymerase III subunit delta' n=1 Tax=Aliisedimentitalea sp. MJ-SS2 TaxID=3049795 RepID=UPI00290FB34C|nr:DNA polymerase III subunit delta' [Alisedimentitalea sp. MJ-SS2]MDU8927348.1 DNA polymerase III subunit delta' [Alisedimentitalea sp. MJ-SS2]
MSVTEHPEPDKVEGAPHPRETKRLIGQDAAEAAFLDAFNSGRLHHAWLLTGPRGVGKATLGWSIARFLLATPDGDDDGGLFGDAPSKPISLKIDLEHLVARRIMAGSDPGLKVIRRGGAGSTDSDREKNLRDGKFSKDIRISEIRELTPFLSLSATEGGRRVVIVDAADEMNVQAANALLKMLEEPPAKTTMLLVAHQPSRLLPTIRSRCRELRLSPLSPANMAAALEQADVAVEPGQQEGLAALSGGSVGEAVRLINLGGLEIYAELVGLLGDLPKLDRSRALKLAEAVATRGAEEKLDLLIALIEIFLARMARAGALGHAEAQEGAGGEAALFARVAPNAQVARRWAELAEKLGGRIRHGRAVNLDPAALILDTILKIRDTAAG